MKPTLYIETSVISYLTAKASRDVIVAGRQAATADFWDFLDRYTAFVSELVRQEAACGDQLAADARLAVLRELPVLEIDDESRQLAASLMSAGAVPDGYPADALHIAVAAVHGIGFIVTWNFKHMNNPAMRSRIRHVVETAGYHCPEICSPDELSGGIDE